MRLTRLDAIHVAIGFVIGVGLTIGFVSVLSVR
jgi:hypothetical protein